ncbi:MAG: hypothetical protein NC432_06515 [Roseburia sp.]|nr:hypothetical protein [Roseburia sp.]MCM1097758.1 hypothetical protein [Ruminococcus flavefaciens]
MAKNYIECLNEEYEKAETAFNEAKAEAIREIENMTPFIAVDYGAGYASHIERITKAAASMKAIAEARSAYEYFLEKKEA